MSWENLRKYLGADDLVKEGRKLENAGTTPTQIPSLEPPKPILKQVFANSIQSPLDNTNSSLNTTSMIDNQKKARLARFLNGRNYNKGY